jgi:hypothetical protein
MNEMLGWATKYAEAGYSVIPVGNDKKPLLKWEQYQKKIASKEEIASWFTKWPTANIAVVTGEISGIVVVDIDDPELKHDLLDTIEKGAEPPITITPRGGRHQWFLRPKEEIRNTTGFIDKVDFRGDGGYVLVPPSKNGNGKGYIWKKSIFETDLTVLPKELINIIKTNSRVFPQNMGKTEQNQTGMSCQQGVSVLTKPVNCSQMLTMGRRDDDLFHIANCLVKGGANNDEIMEIVKRLANSCVPPFPINDAFEKIQSALNRSERKERTISEDIRQWCDMQDGFFLIADLCSALNLTTRTDKGVAYTTMGRLVKDGVLEKFGAKSGCYRRLNKDISEMDWETAPMEDLDIDYPLGISGLVKTYPSNIIIVAGTSNSGKTTFLLDFARRNINKFPISYFNSEMGLSELRMRLELFENCDLNTWKKVKFFERGDNFDDVINPDGINVIDYLEVLDDFWKVGQQIKSIHDKLNTGIAVIAIQKNKNAELGRGGALGTEKCRLYLNLEYGKIKLIKGKNWRTSENPNRKSKDFKLVQGWQFIDDGGWVDE